MHNHRAQTWAKWDMAVETQAVKVIATGSIFGYHPLVDQLALRDGFVKLPADDILNHTRVLAYGNTTIHV
jgi:hypothetical protein